MLQALRVWATRRYYRHTNAQAWRGKFTDAAYSTLQLPGPQGQLQARMYSSKVGASKPLIIYFHGGGWVIGDLISHHPFCQQLREHTGCTVVAVDYRLAPEHPYPAALDDAMSALLAEAHKGAGGKAKAPATAAKPTINMYNLGKPAEARVQGNYRLTEADSDSDVRHIILDFGGLPFPVLEGQSIGIIPPGTDDEGKPHLPRLYSVSSPRDGERPNFNNLSLTVKREDQGLCSNYVCDLSPGDTVQVTGPFGSTFLLPADPNAHLLMICTGTGSAPFRGFTMRRQREQTSVDDSLTLVFGARRPAELPYFGPLKKVPERFLRKLFAFSRQDDAPKQYVQDRLRDDAERVADLLRDPNGYIYICGLKAMETGVEEALSDIARGIGMTWTEIRDKMREDGRYHVETY